LRLFVALDIPEDVRRKIDTLVVRLRDLCRNGRWVRVGGVHITLKFIGEISVEKAEEVKTALATVPFPAPITMLFRGLGFFPNDRRPRVLWAGIEARRELGALAAGVETSLEPLGIAREQRAFSPHLTLARFDSPSGLKELQAATAAAGPLEFGSAVAKDFHLYQSILKRGGAEYTRLSSYDFAEDESR
jgi:RNA 2',3'-cyclic 3'-phosphodiesterase